MLQEIKEAAGELPNEGSNIAKLSAAIKRMQQKGFSVLGAKGLAYLSYSFVSVPDEGIQFEILSTRQFKIGDTLRVLFGISYQNQLFPGQHFDLIKVVQHTITAQELEESGNPYKLILTSSTIPELSYPVLTQELPEGSKMREFVTSVSVEQNRELSTANLQAVSFLPPEFKAGSPTTTGNGFPVKFSVTGEQIKETIKVCKDAYLDTPDGMTYTIKILPEN